MEYLQSLSANGDLGLYILRLIVGLVFLYHAMPKLMMPKKMAKMMGASASVPIALGLLEALSALALVSGYQLELAAVILSIIMLGAIMMKIVKWHIPFSAMNKMGWEYDLVLLSALISILFTGGGIIGF